MLVKLECDDVNECVIAVEESVASDEQVSFELALALVLAEHLDDASRRREEFVVCQSRCIPLAIGGFKERLRRTRDGLIRAEPRKFRCSSFTLTTHPALAFENRRGERSRGRGWKGKLPCLHPSGDGEALAVVMVPGDSGSFGIKPLVGVGVIQVPMRIDQLLHRIGTEACGRFGDLPAGGGRACVHEDACHSDRSAPRYYHQNLRGR